MICIVSIFGAGLVFIVFIISGISSQNWNKHESFPIPSVVQWTNTPILDNRTDGIAVFAHISDIHVGRKGYLTENVRRFDRLTIQLFYFTIMHS
ncbi:MAG: hypothetical protein EZS28_037309 [Streblomastix strix]|uniref:Uncharacterized protein n=1 Tax=Streblomastix strix TaxID=222440 RepID=A0A5J4UC35_9EUKA|nr:MAG: hypothetical protein EZS28_037309 [Streblomastix strix]